MLGPNEARSTEQLLADMQVANGPTLAHNGYRLQEGADVLRGLAAAVRDGAPLPRERLAYALDGMADRFDELGKTLVEHAQSIAAANKELLDDDLDRAIRAAVDAFDGGGDSAS